MTIGEATAINVVLTALIVYLFVLTFHQPLQPVVLQIGKPKFQE